MIKYLNLIILLSTLLLIVAGINRHVVEPAVLPAGAQVVYILKPTVNYLQAQSIVEDFVNTCPEGRKTGYIVEVVNFKANLLEKQCY